MSQIPLWYLLEDSISMLYCVDPMSVLNSADPADPNHNLDSAEINVA